MTPSAPALDQTKVARYQSTMGSPANSATSEPKARNGPNGTAVLRPSLTPLRAMITPPTIVPASMRHEQGDADVAPEEQAHDERELHVPHAHAAGIGDRRDEQEAAGRDGRDQVLGQRARIGQHEDRRRGDRADDHQLVRDDPEVDVDDRHRHEQQHEGEAEPDLLARAEAQDDERHQHRGRQLDERVAPGDRRPARAAAAAQQEPREDGDVVVGLDRRLAAGAAGTRDGEGLALRQPVGDHVQERSEDRTEHGGQRGAVARGHGGHDAGTGRGWTAVRLGALFDAQAGRDGQARRVGLAVGRRQEHRLERHVRAAR